MADPEDVQRDAFVEQEFQKHSAVSIRVREKIRKQKEQVVNLWDIWVEKYNELPKWLRYIFAALLYLFVLPVILLMFNGMIKFTRHEWIKFFVACGCIAGVWALLKWVVIV